MFSQVSRIHSTFKNVARAPLKFTAPSELQIHSTQLLLLRNGSTTKAPSAAKGKEREREKAAKEKERERAAKEKEREKEKAAKEREKEKAAKEREKEKAAKEREREKEKAMKEREKQKNLKLKEKTKLALEKEAKAKQREKLKKEKEEKVKRPLSAFTFFTQATIPVLRKQNTSLKLTDIIKDCSKAWKSLPAEQKKQYEDQAKKDKERYEKQKKEYQAAHPKRPLSPYLLFSVEQRPLIQKENSQLGITEISKIIGQKWKALDNSKKEAFKKIYQTNLEKFKKTQNLD